MRLYDRANFAAGTIAQAPGKKDPENPLSFLKLEPGKTTATNRIAAVVVRTPIKPSGDEEGVQPSYLQKKMAKHLAALFEGIDGETPVECSARLGGGHNGKELAFAFPGGTDVEMVQPHVQLAFPSLASVWPKGKPALKVSLNAKVLFELAKVMNECCSDSSGKWLVELQLYPDRDGKPQPIRITSGYDSTAAERFDAVMMPLDRALIGKKKKRGRKPKSETNGDGAQAAASEPEETKPTARKPRGKKEPKGKHALRAEASA